MSHSEARGPLLLSACFSQSPCHFLLSVSFILSVLFYLPGSAHLSVSVSVFLPGLDICFSLAICSVTHAYFCLFALVTIL